MRGGEVEDQQSRDLYELCALLLSILRYPSLHLPSSLLRHAPRLTDFSPAGLASLMLGISLSLMLCGSLTFFVGFILMPWVFGFVVVFYLVGLVSNLSLVRRVIAAGITTVAGHGKSTEKKNMPGQILSQIFDSLSEKWQVNTSNSFGYQNLWSCLISSPAFARVSSFGSNPADVM